MDNREKILSILNLVDIEVNVIDNEQDIKVFPKSYNDFEFIRTMCDIVVPYRWYTSELVKWFRDGITYYDEISGEECGYDYPEYIIIEFK